MGSPQLWVIESNADADAVACLYGEGAPDINDQAIVIDGGGQRA